MNEGSRVVVLLALGLTLALGAVLWLRAADARGAREAAPERALRQARDQQAATAEILAAMAASPPDLQRVLDTIARNAARVCDGFLAAVTRFDGQLIHLVAHHDISPESLEVLRRQYPCPPDDTSLVGRAIRQREVVHVSDASRDARVPALWQELPRAQRYKCLVVVPMLRDGRALGSLSVARLESDFSERQIQLLQTFADQAVIAIENVRLFQELETRNRELTESLEQQTATAEILGVISRSPGDVQPVFEAILDSAIRLCGATIGGVYRLEGGLIHLAARRNPAPGMAEALASYYPRPLDAAGSVARAVREREVVHVPDVLADATLEGAPRELSRVGRFRSQLTVPLLRDGSAVGAIAVGRAEPGLFPDAQVALLRTFADQAVIAIENARLFEELQARNRDLTESLEQQTATAEILRAISSSPTDTQPVFDAIVTSAVRLCDGRSGSLYRLEDGVIHQVAYVNPIEEAHAAYRAAYPKSLDQAEPEVRRHYTEGTLEHVGDVDTEPGLSDDFRARARTAGYRSVISVPMFRANLVIGTLAGARAGPDRTPRPFSDREIRLLQTFADQAVIAIENVRLFKELEARNRDLTEALEQQTATGEILQAISASPTDLTPVFETILRSAVRLCDGFFSLLFLFDGERLDLTATHNVPPEGLEALERRYPLSIESDQAGLTALAVRARRPIASTDIQADPSVPAAVHLASEAFGQRAAVAVPLFREGEPVGALTVSRREARAFSLKELALLQTFAAQAVIAIENVRLFQELQARNRDLTEALEQQTATGEILRVISSSPTDLAPVMEAVTRNAVRLARADHALIGEAAEGRIRWLATSGCPLVSEGPPISRQLPSGRAIIDCQTTQVEDVTELTDDFPGVRRAYDELGVRTILATPLVRQGVAIGVLLVRRTTVRPFTGTEIELLRTFADQAVVAIENVRLFQELEARNRDLTELLQQQTATAEILRVISRSATDTQPVFDAIVASAVRLCDARMGALYRIDDETISVMASAMDAAARQVHDAAYPRPVATLELPMRRFVSDPAPVHLVDVDVAPGLSDAYRERCRTLGFRTGVLVPMLRDGRAIGVISVGRAGPGRTPRPYSDREIGLLQVFAEQAVIAIENVRLFKELEARNRELTESLEQQTATGEILRVISSSPTDIRPVFDAIVRSAARLGDAARAGLMRVEGRMLMLEATEGMSETELEAHRRSWPRELGPDSAGGRAILARQVVQILDAKEDPAYTVGSALTQGYRTALSVPLLREGSAVGAISLWRREVRPFSEKQVQLVQTFADQAVIAIENVRLFRELAARNRDLTESLEQQTATAEILRVISSSPTDIQPVFDTIVERALRLCDGLYSGVYRVDGDQLHLMAHNQVAPEAVELLRQTSPRPVSRESLVGRAILDREVVLVHDVESDPAISDWSRRRSRLLGYRSLIVVPMLREGVPIGAIHVSRSEPRPFSDRELALLRIFADQAVIAIENVRLFTELGARNRELTEALDQQTATAEILGAISRSPTDLQPVLEAVARNASRLCGAANVSLYRVEGTLMRKVAEEGPPLTALRIDETRPITRSTISGRAIVDRTTVHLADYQSAESVQEYPDVRRDTGIKTTIGIPLLREGVAIGAFTAYRIESRPFSDREIALLQTFADQAVIAIENVRLFQALEARNRELTESLDQQTATAEILRVISSSPTNVQPVFDTIVESVARLCDGVFTTAFRFDGELITPVAYNWGIGPEGREAHERLYPRPPSRDSVVARAILDRVVVHLGDVDADADVPAATRELARVSGYRSVLAVPMLREGLPIGALGIGRRGMNGQARPFSTREIALVRTFADQAVIAIENVRLFTELGSRNRELTESLEQQTATADILRAISSSPTDTQPVFDTIARSAVRLCDGRDCFVWRFDGALVDIVAHQGFSPEVVHGFRQLYPVPIEADTLSARSIRERAVVHRPDIPNDPDVSEFVRRIAQKGGYRTGVVVPMLRTDSPIGAIGVTRGELTAEPRPFSDKEIALLQTFADQAVIAIENVRLFKELEARNRDLTESLEQQTATAEILRVISRSPTAVQPVFESIIERAIRLADGLFGAAFSFDGELVHLVAHQGLSDEAMALNRQVYPMAPGPGQLTALAVLEKRVVHLRDVDTDPDVPEMTRQLARVIGFRSLLAVPMLREDRPVGVLTITRVAGEFAPRHIELVKTFADQAVIAIENVRLFQELEARNRELTESLEQQTATSEILRAISSSPTDTQPVFDTIAQRAVRVCDGRQCTVYQLDGTLVRFVAHHGLPPEALEIFRRAYPLPVDADTLAVRSIREGAVVHVQDILTDPSETSRRFGQTGGFRSAVVVPMLRGGRAVGAIGVGRSTPDGAPRPFSDNEIALLRTFADQGVIAIENVRLFQELEARTRELARSVEELQALSEVGRAVSSTLDLPTVLATIVARAVQLSGTSGGVIYEYSEATQTFQLRASHRIEERLVEAIRATDLRLGVGATGQAAVRRVPVEVVDTLDDQDFQVTPAMRATLNQLGYRSILGVPLLLDRRIMGALTVFRREPGSFPAETVNLLQTFATQSALAIQNARLFREIEAKSRELEVASRHKSQFLANMSHELRTPLNAILGYTELLVDGIYGELSPKAGDVMARIDRSGKHLLGLINDVLDLSKIEAGQLELGLADYSLTEVVHAVVTQVESLAGEKGIILQAAVAPDLPAGRGDERRLTQVLLNLVGNAIKFTEVGSVRIAAHRDGDAFVVSVADTGPGIVEADRQRIFEEFQQADSSSTRKKGGTGLGLSIARRIVELHGGRIWVESTVGRGSTFTFRVPVRVERQAARA